MDEHVFAAFALDEAVALLVREPLDGALGQVLLPSCKYNDGPGTEPPTYCEAARTLDGIFLRGKCLDA
jgi:hypothetical protein